MIHPEAGVLILLMALAVPVVALAKRIDIAYPIPLVLFGLLLGFIPGLPRIQLDPNIVLLIFLPPLLYWESITAPLDVMWDNLQQVGLLAVGLVILTTCAVALLAHAIVPELSWPAAFVMGAIVSPTDELAAIPVLEHFGLPRHVIAIVDGESLLNDATALVIYATALAIITTGQFSAAGIAWHFVAVVAGSVVIGLLIGWLAIEAWRRFQDQDVQSVVSFLCPFAAYFPAQYLQLSGVLAVVVAGVYLTRHAARVLKPATRRQTSGFWNTLVFVANAVLFLVVGLQLHQVAANAFAKDSWPFVLGVSVAVNVLILLVRVVFVLLAEYAPTRVPQDHSAPDWRHALVVAWSGLRGAISLAAALAIPFALPGGAQFPHRDLIIFVTFSVILVTLVGGGLTLPMLVKQLKIEGGTEEQDETRMALLEMFDAALARIAKLERESRIDPEHARTIRERFEHRRDVQQQPANDRAAHLDDVFSAERAVDEAQRDVLIDLHDRGAIDNVVFRKLQSQLDQTIRST